MTGNTPLITRDTSIDTGKFALLAGLSLLVAPVIGVIYAFGIYYVPLLIIKVLLAMLAASALAFLPSYLEKVPGVRMVHVIAVTLVAAIVGYYTHWAMWVSLFTEEIPFMQLLTNPSGLWMWVKVINSIGPWAIDELTFSGGFLWAVWAAEAVCLLVGPIYVLFRYPRGQEAGI